MKLIKTSFGILCAAIIIASCGEKNKKEVGQKETETKTDVATPNTVPTRLEGTWEIIREEGTPPDGQSIGETYEFKGDQVTIGMNGNYNTATTEVTDSTFSVQAGSDGHKMIFPYYFIGDTLVRHMMGGTWRFYLIKR